MEQSQIDAMHVAACVKRGAPASFIYDRHFPVAIVRQSNIEREAYAELREIRASIKALQARIDYVLEDLREYRKRASRAREAGHLLALTGRPGRK